MDNKPVKALSRILTQTEAQHLLDRFEAVHCEKDGIRCPGWDPTLSHMIGDEEQTGGCRYKNSQKLCNNLSAAAQGTLIIEIRPRNEDDLKREAEMERGFANLELKKLKAMKADLEEKIISVESKLRQHL